MFSKKRKFSSIEVFAMKRGATAHYVERERVDDELLKALTTGKHVCIYGCTKQGKTSACKKLLGDSVKLKVNCDNDWKVSDIHAAILKCAGCSIEVGRTEAIRTGADGNAKISAKVKIPLTAEVEGELGGGGSVEVEENKQYASIPIDLSNPKEVIDILSKYSEEEYIIIEEFHYLSEYTQKNFSSKLKTFFEESKYIFIVVGVWLDRNRLVYLNPDLSGRVSTINADLWSKDDLRRVITEGGDKLNVEFDEKFIAALVKGSAGSLYHVREVCYRVCDAEGIVTTLPTRRTIGDPRSARSHLDRICSESADYEAFVREIASIIPALEKDQNTRNYNREAFLEVISYLITATPADMQNGISLTKIRRTIGNKHPKRWQPRENQVLRVIEMIKNVQIEKRLKKIFDYDSSAKKMLFADKGFVLWRRLNKADAIKDAFYEAADPYR